MMLKHALALFAIGSAPLAVSAKHFVVQGADLPSNRDVPVRMNVNELYSKGGPQWDLYLRALKSLQDKDASDPLSYFQVAGIHGLPWMEWNDGGKFAATGWQGYCPHGENLFLPWHRPFVLLFEQLLVAEARKLAEEYPPKYRSQYVDAAIRLRSPYWDWSAEAKVPQCTVPRVLTVNVPDGQGLKRVSINNPLQSFTYPEKARSGEFGTFPRYSQTVRCPAPYQYPTTANQRLAGRGLKQSTYDAFTYSSTFDEFTVTGQNSIGLEEMHNNIHWDAGCEGQFLDAATSGFDPLFMLHHTHVDRLWTYWQFINPSEALFSNSYYGFSRYSTPQNTVISPDSPLPPFYDASDSYYTSRKVASIKGLGYTYQELQYWNKTEEQLTQDATRLMNDLYQPSWAKSTGKRDSPPQPRARYFARVELDRTQVERPCSVNVFIDGKPAGSVVVMQLPESGILHGSLAIDEHMNPIVTASKAAASANDAITSAEHLMEVEITKPDGTIIPVNTVGSLKLTLEQVSVMPAKSNTEFPKPGKSKKHPAGVRDRHRKKDHKDGKKE
ncbi:hypothetical protein QQS21_004288 [Conoideocrella luteorostrata]|uniref:tyrosinase n=1 Tax=Conoideocrella luteorostrata TaxID=1105319 RepID=A0AAJ0FUT5_9HYPO|nr:hypothetical protein QQS21_004288 [Conoideocrella luteorostrata]